MTTRIAFIAIALAALIAQPVAAQVTTFSLYGDTSLDTPTEGVTLFPSAIRGVVEIDDTGASPVLNNLEARVQWANIFDGTITCCAGTTVDVVLDGTIVASSTPQNGTGSTTTSINFGDIAIDWTPFPDSKIRCIVNAGGGCGGCVTSCTAFGVLPGNEFGGVPPLSGPQFSFDPWDFNGTGEQFNTPVVQIVDLGTVGQKVLADVRFTGVKIEIPTLPLLGLGVLGAVLLGTGARIAVKRRKS